MKEGPSSLTAEMSVDLLVEVLRAYDEGSEVVLSRRGIKIDGRPISTTVAESDTKRPKNIFMKQGNGWHLKYEGEEQFFIDMRGFEFIKTLLSSPGTKIPAVTLDYGISANVVNAIDTEAIASLPEGMTMMSLVGEKIYDAADRMRLTNQQKELQENLDNELDHERRVELEHQIEKIDDLLRKSRFRGKDQRTSSPASCARMNVKNAITRAIRTIDTKIPSLATHLRYSISTGSACGYFPDRKIIWQTE